MSLRFLQKKWKRKKRRRRKKSGGREKAETEQPREGEKSAENAGVLLPFYTYFKL